MSNREQLPKSQTQWALRATLALLVFTTGATTFTLIWYWRGRQNERRAPTTLLVSRGTTPAPSASSNRPHNERRPTTVDLSRHYNAVLTNAWHFPSGRGSATLRALPQGTQEFGGVPFEVRGIIQLASIRTRHLPQYPERSAGIPIGGRCRTLHFLQATGWTAYEGTTIASYWIHYSDGTAIEFPIVYGEHLREWHGRSDRKTEITSGQLAWQDNNPATKRRLYQCRWENPKPDIEVLSVDFVSAMTDCFPFLIAITAE